MNKQILDYYNLELQHIRQMSGEFAKEYPKIAARLALDDEGKEICPDPFVERLLEGFAYLTSRIHLKLDAEFPRFTQSFLETVYPEYLCPTPSMAIVRFEPDFKNKALINGFDIPRGTPIRAMSGGLDSSPCTYKTAHGIKVWPVRLLEAKYLDRNVVSLALPPTAEGISAFHLTLESTAETKIRELQLDSLTFYVHGSDSLPSTVLEHLFAHGIGAWIRDPLDNKKSWQPLPKNSLRLVGHEKSQSLLPAKNTSFEGYRLLKEYFALPQRFHFFEIQGLQKAFAVASGNRIEIALPLSQSDYTIGPSVNASLFNLNCTPVINLFEKRADRIDLSTRGSEFHVVVDRTRPLDYEIYSIQSVTGYGNHAGEEQSFHSFYQSRELDSPRAGYFTINRAPRTPSEREKRFGRLSSYSGSEVFINLVDGNAAPYSASLEQIGISALCTNRHLPIRLSQSDRSNPFTIEFNGPITEAYCLSGPTPPRPSLAMGEIAWRLISHLSLNYLSITDSSKSEGAGALRELLKLYVDPNDKSTLKQIDGILLVQSAPVLQRIPSPNMITFARGLEMTIVFDDIAFAGSGLFVLGMVLEHFFSRLVTINSFTETVIKSKQRGEVIRWPARTGRKQIL
jgi:type VI secretion system protein ImpG